MDEKRERLMIQRSDFNARIGTYMDEEESKSRKSKEKVVNTKENI